jgi:hypothetical protein
MNASVMKLLVANRFQVGGAVCGLLLSFLVAISQIPSSTLSTRPFKSRYAASLRGHLSRPFVFWNLEKPVSRRAGGQNRASLLLGLRPTPSASRRPAAGGPLFFSA